VNRPISHLLVGTPRTIAGTVYGTIVIMAALTAGRSAYHGDLTRLIGVVVSTAVIFWIAHVYAHGLAESASLGKRLNGAEIVNIARHEHSILLAAILPTAALVLGALGVFRDATAIWLAIGAGAATLAAQGIRYARVERLSLLGTTVAVGVNVALGLGIVAVKVFLAH
jgi:hypothetical protein